MDAIPIQKYIASSGMYSRRKAELLVKNGVVRINDNVARMGDKVEVGDIVFVMGKPVAPVQKHRYIILNKPLGYVCTHAMYQNEHSVFELVRVRETLYIAGRLDKDSEGLVLLTTDGDLMNRITHPRYEHEKTYQVWTTESDTAHCRAICDDLVRGVDIGNGDGVVRAKRAEYQGDGIFTLVISEGKNRQVRRMFGNLGVRMIRLLRVAIGPVQLGDLPSAEWREVEGEKLRKMFV